MVVVAMISTYEAGLLTCVRIESRWAGTVRQKARVVLILISHARLARGAVRARQACSVGAGLAIALRWQSIVIAVHWASAQLI